MPNRIIIPANYTVDVIVKYDPNTGQTELRVHNRGTKQIPLIQLAGLLSEHSAALIKSSLEGKVELTPIDKGGTPNAS